MFLSKGKRPEAQLMRSSPLVSGPPWSWSWSRSDMLLVCDPAVTAPIRLGCLDPDSVCKPLVSSHQSDQRLRLWDGDYYACWWTEILFPPTANPPVFTTSHRSPRPLSTTTSTNWADYCKMCVWFLCALQSGYVCVCVEGGSVQEGAQGFYPLRELHALSWEEPNEGLMSNILWDGEKLLEAEPPCVCCSEPLVQTPSNNWLFTSVLLLQRPGLFQESRADWTGVCVAAGQVDGLDWTGPGTRVQGSRFRLSRVKVSEAKRVWTT